MNISPMSTPESREDFELRVHALREQLRLGKMMFAEEARRGTDQLLRMRLLPNGRVDLLTIDEAARSMANMAYGMLLDEDAPRNMVDVAGSSGGQ